jgi:hypothetical protein
MENAQREPSASIDHGGGTDEEMGDDRDGDAAA